MNTRPDSLRWAEVRIQSLEAQLAASEAARQRNHERYVEVKDEVEGLYDALAELTGEVVFQGGIEQAYDVCRQARRARQAAEARAVETVIPEGPITAQTEFVWVSGIAFVNADKHEQVATRWAKKAEAAETRADEIIAEGASLWYWAEQHHLRPSEFFKSGLMADKSAAVLRAVSRYRNRRSAYVHGDEFDYELLVTEDALRAARAAANLPVSIGESLPDAPIA